LFEFYDHAIDSVGFVLSGHTTWTVWLAKTIEIFVAKPRVALALNGGFI